VCCGRTKGLLPYLQWQDSSRRPNEADCWQEMGTRPVLPQATAGSPELPRQDTATDDFSLSARIHPLGGGDVLKRSKVSERFA